MVRIAAVLLCLTTIGSADPMAPKPKSATDKYPLEALQAFVEGVTADRHDQFQVALNAYNKSFAKSPQANTAFNLGVLMLRLERVDDAARYFRSYLELSPTAADRPQIERLMKKLATSAPVITVGGVARRVDQLDAIILLDGVVVGTSPVTLRPTTGSHVAERITASTYAIKTFVAKPGHREYVELQPQSKATGNVVISGIGQHASWREGAVVFSAGASFVLAKGHYETVGRNHLGKPLACAPIAFDVKSEQDVTYVRVELDAGATPSDCRTVRRVDVQALKVTP